MAAISITAANVFPSTGAVLYPTRCLAGETITAGQVVYLKTSNSRWMKAQCDGTAEEAGDGTVVGIALADGVSGRFLDVQVGGKITIGGTATVGTVYCVGATAGAIVPWSDLVSTNYVRPIGIGSTAAVLDLCANVHPGVQIP